jgi:hypothetical protein
MSGVIPLFPLHVVMVIRWGNKQTVYWSRMDKRLFFVTFLVFGNLEYEPQITFAQNYWVSAPPPRAALTYYYWHQFSTSKATHYTVLRVLVLSKKCLYHNQHMVFHYLLHYSYPLRKYTENGSWKSWKEYSTWDTYEFIRKEATCLYWLNVAQGRAWSRGLMNLRVPCKTLFFCSRPACYDPQFETRTTHRIMHWIR